MAGTDAPDEGHAPGEDDAPAPEAGRPLWRRGSRAAVVALGVALVVQGLVPLLLGRSDGADTSVDPQAALSITDGLGGWPLLVAAAAFVVFSRPWRLPRRRR